MDLSEIATISGKGGLFRVLKPSKGGVIMETLDDKKTKVIASTNHRVSILHEISIYTTSAEGSIQLEDVFPSIYKEFGDDTGLDKSASKEELVSFIKHIIPDYDEDRVYPSDIKKLVNWYGILVKRMPELFKEERKKTRKNLK